MTGRGETDPIRPLVKTILDALEDKKGENLRALSVGEIVGYADVLVIASAQSTTQVQALVDSVEKAVKGRWKASYVNRSPDDSWWILDFVDVVVHVFKREEREHYNLEGLWADAPEYRV